MKYSDKFWKKNWDAGLADFEPGEYDTTFVEMLNKTLSEFPDKIALKYLGVDITFGEVDRYSNQFANMLLENGFEKGDVVGINLPNTPQYMIAVVGTLKAGCIVSGVSPLMSAEQIKYQLTDLS
ncbi:MAG: AMP-binding protein, partial [Deltaproteobacteria bacterium]|nr:AMP-binding protein [Deltaproteobacteria bacterium]